MVQGVAVMVVQWSASLAARMMDVGTGALVAMDHGRSPYREVCSRAAALVAASSAAYVHVDLVHGTSRTVCWMECGSPSIDVPVVPWLASVDDESSQGAATVSLTAGPGHMRFLCLARERSFQPADRDLLALLREPLLALDAHLRTLEREPLGLPDTEGAVTARSPDAAPGITAREAEVLGLLAKGMTARAIATSLGLSPRTVHKHLGSLYTKLGTHDRLSAVTRGQQLGILPPAVGLRRLGS